MPMSAIDFDAERAYDKRFSAKETFWTDRLKIECSYFEAGQFVPIHAPRSDIVISVREEIGVFRDDEDTHRVESGDIVVIKIETACGIRASEDQRLELLPVTAPPPSNVEHEPAQESIRHSEFDPTDGTITGNGN
jgi:quercetin dioxygenase-like cupin family protein